MNLPQEDSQESFIALLPLILFLLIFIGSGWYLTMAGVKMAFYQVSAVVAILPAVIWAMAMGRGPLQKKLDVFIRGTGNPGIITMCLIYLAAGAFAAVSKSIGGVDSTVNLGLLLLSPQILLPGLFVITAFIATAMGTSMGTIAAIAPIAVGLADKTSLGLPIVMSAVVGGAMFGDNLSIISDTTIAATRTQGCEMRDKFIFNFRIALPAALLTCVILYMAGEGSSLPPQGDYNMLKVLPYGIILALALSGINVFVVLMTGIIVAAGIGFLVMPDYSLLVLSREIYAGFGGMQEILILTLLIGGLAELIAFHGGIRFVINRIDMLTRKCSGSSPRWGEGGIAALVSLVNMCTANNTVAILITGSIAKEVAEKHGVDPRRSASLLDVFSCSVQGMLPYGAQVLLAGSIAGISPLSITGHMYYCFLLAVSAIGAMLFRPSAK